MNNKSLIKVFFKFIGVVAILPIVIFITVTLTLGLSFKSFSLDEILFKQEVHGKPDRWFPIAVLRQSNITLDSMAIDIIFLKDKSKYLQDYPTATFQLPAERKSSFNEQVLKRCRNNEFYPTKVTKGCFMQKYEILNDDGIYQYIKVTYDPDYDYVNTGWYKTDGFAIIPLEHLKYFGGGFAIGLISYSFMISSVIYFIIILLIIIKYLKNRRAKKTAPDEGLRN